MLSLPFGSVSILLLILGAWSGEHYGVRMFAYSGYRFNRSRDLSKATKFVDPSQFRLKIDSRGDPAIGQVRSEEYLRPMKEISALTTNSVAQWSLNYMEYCRLRELADGLYPILEQE